MTGEVNKPMPVVAECLNSLGMDYEVLQCDPALADTANFCEHYGFKPEESANAIIVASKKEPIVYCCCIVLANYKLDVNKKVSKLLGIKRLSFASADQTRQLTGMEIGGVTPFGLPEMPIYIDDVVMASPRIALGGGNRSTKIVMKPAELKKLPGAEFVAQLGMNGSPAG